MAIRNCIFSFILLLIFSGCSTINNSQSQRKLASDPIYEKMMISNGLDFVCGVDNEGLKCSGIYPSFMEGNFKMVSAGSWHVCVLDSQENIRCWGKNDKGQARRIMRGNYKMVSAGGFHTCAISSVDNKGLSCWGDTYHLGLSKLHRLGLLQGNFKMVSSGYTNVCVLAEDGIRCAGKKQYGATPNFLKGDFKMVSTSGTHTCMIQEDGLACVGDNRRGQAPKFVKGKFKMVSTGTDFTCAIDEEGARCWGDNLHKRAPKLIKGNFQTVSAGHESACAYGADGVTCWGRFGDSLSELELKAL